MSGLCAVSAVFTTAASFNAQQTASLHFLATPMLEMDHAALRNQIEQGLIIELFEFPEGHRVIAMLNPKSEIRNVVDPLPVFGSEDRQFFHHELRFSDCANHVRAGGLIPLLRHALASVAAPALHIRALHEIT